jgi:hypothetical protein
MSSHGVNLIEFGLLNYVALGEAPTACGGVDYSITHETSFGIECYEISISCVIYVGANSFAGQALDYANKFAPTVRST